MKRLFILLPILILAGCTITKRNFNSGYRVEWKKFHSKEEIESDKLNLIKLREVSSDKPEIQSKSIILSIDTINLSAQINEPLVVDQFISLETSAKELKESEPGEFQNSPIQEKRVTEIQDEVFDEVEPKVEPFTWAALGCLVLGGILALLSFVVSIPEIALIFTLALGVLVIVFSIISVVHIHRNPNEYKGKWLSWALFGLSTAAIGTVLFMMILGALRMTNSINF